MSATKNIGANQPGNTLLNSLPVKLATQQTQNKQLKEFLAQFKPGDSISVQIIRGLSEKTALISLKGKEFVAETNRFIKDGETLQAVVQQNKPTLILKPIAQQKPSVPTSLLRLAQQNPPAQFDLKGALETALKMVQKETDFFRGKPSLSGNLTQEESLSQGGEKGSRALLNAVKNSGLFLESAIKKLSPEGASVELLNKDFKSNLLKLQELLQKELSNLQSGERAVLFKEVVKNILQNIESNQALNLQAKEQGDHQLVQIPYLSNGEVKTLKMYVKGDTGRGTESNDQPTYIVLFLDLQYTDKIRVDLKMNKNNVEIKLSVINEEIQSLFVHNLIELEEQLAQAGYSATIDCAIACKKFIEEDLTNTTCVSDELSLLDCKV